MAAAIAVKRRKKQTLSKTEAQQSYAEGNGIYEVIVGLEAQFVLTTRNAEGEQCYEARDCVTVNMKNCQGEDCVREAKVRDNKDGSYKISYFATETGRCHLSVKVNEKHVHESPFETLVKPRQFRPVLSFGLEGYEMTSSPWGVAVNTWDEIAVADLRGVKVFDSDGTYLRSCHRNGDNNGHLNWPGGIAFVNGNILVGGFLEEGAQLFSERGEYLSQFGTNQINFPYGFSVDRNGNVYVADGWDKVIKIFSDTGHFLRKIDGGGSFNTPLHCVQYEYYLIVSNVDENCINVFNEDGDFLYKFGKKGSGDGEFDIPSFLSVNKAGHLLVCDERNHRVQVFELSGKFVTKFGRKGSGIGEFINGPNSTAVLSDGRIVVCDSGNYRIQIFE